MPDNRIRFGIYQAYDYPTINIHRATDTNTEVLIPGTWQHIAGTFDLFTQELIIYVDGIEIQSTVLSSSSILDYVYNEDFPLLIGKITIVDGSSRLFNGYIDEVRIWNSTRTQEEIQNTMNTELTGSETGLVGYFNMNLENSPCGIVNCSDQNHGYRGGIADPNNTPQYSDEVPSIQSVLCESNENCFPVGIETIETTKINVYPNPFIDEIFINFDKSKIYKLKEIEIINIKGEVIFKDKIDLNTNEDFQIPLANQANGIYFIKISLDDEILIKKIIKSNLSYT